MARVGGGVASRLGDNRRMSSRAPRAVFFDLGGTLFSYREIPALTRSIFAEALQRLGVDPDPAAIGPAYTQAAAAAERRYAERDYYLHRDLFLDTYRGLVDALGASPHEDFFEWLYAAQRDVMVTAVPLRDDCLETLTTLRERGHSLSIVSNIDDDYLEPMVRNFGLTPHLDHWSSSEEARSCKPHRGIFELAVGKAGCDPEDVVFVGDSRHHDIRGAREMGMTSVLISEPGGIGPRDPGDAAPDYLIERLGELVAVLESDDSGRG
jgi:HAD superfamily hydrolase (TIGR01509 family)